MVGFTSPNGNPVSVNPFQVVKVLPRHGGTGWTDITFVGGAYATVLEDYMMVVDAISLGLAAMPNT